MKKIFKIFVVFTMVISLTSCELWLERFAGFLDEIEQEYEDENDRPDSDDDEYDAPDSDDEEYQNLGEDENNLDGNTTDDENQTSGGDQNVVLNGAVNITSGRFQMAKGSTAEKYWYADEGEYIYAFDADGKCTLNGTRYYLKNVSDYEASNDSLTGSGFKPIWSDDHTNFIIDLGFHDYTEVDEAIEKIEERFLCYTITDSSGTRTVTAPTEEEKVEKMREVFGFTFDDLGSSYANYEYTVTRELKKVLVSYQDNAAVSDVNALAAVAFELCKSIPENGKMYNYLGKYGEEITSAPETDNIFWSPEFSYYYKDNEIHVQAQIGNSGDYKNTLLLFVYVYK